jgi:hypothetical protein
MSGLLWVFVIALSRSIFQSVEVNEGAGKQHKLSELLRAAGRKYKGILQICAGESTQGHGGAKRRLVQ